MNLSLQVLAQIQPYQEYSSTHPTCSTCESINEVNFPLDIFAS